MREILFRGKAKINGVWLYGDLRQWSEKRKGICDYTLGRTHDVDRKTIGQFTGLTDKNGKKIFEGDILEYTSFTGTGIKEVFRAIVFWDEHRWSYKTIYNNRWTNDWNNKGYTCDVYKSTVSKYAEVVGNIHDNPELLEG